VPQPRRPPRKPHSLSAAADALLSVAPLVTRWIERLLAGHEPPLTPAQYLGLRAIGGESLGAAELARRTGVSGPAVSQLVAGLADAGLVERRVAEHDRRRQALTLTDGGRRALDSANALILQRLEALLDGLPRPETDALARALPRVEELLSGTAPPRRPAPPRPPPPRPPRG
jgi:DNA-binding MarR family transcriptional regulator